MLFEIIIFCRLNNVVSNKLQIVLTLNKINL